MVITSPIIIFFLGIFPSIFWLLFFLIEDSKRPEPKVMIAEVFSAGVVAAAIAVALENYATEYLARYPLFRMNTPGEFLAFAAIEEIVIFLAAYLMIARNRFFNEHVDAMVYLITAALGFAALENVFYLLSSGPELALQTILIRSVGATLLHAVASGFIGFYWAERKLLRGLAIAILIHWIFDCLAFFVAEQTFSIAFVLVCSFFIFHDFDILKGEDESRIKKHRALYS